MEAAVNIGTLIITSPEVRNGQPRIAGTGVTVQRVVSWYKLGLSPEEISDEIEHLTLAQIYAALTYYHANQEQIEARMASEAEEAARLEKKNAPSNGQE